MSPVSRVGLPYFQNYLKPNDRKQLLCILLCDGVHFQGLIFHINHNKTTLLISYCVKIQTIAHQKRLQRVSLKVEQMFCESPYF